MRRSFTFNFLLLILALCIALFPRLRDWYRGRAQNRTAWSPVVGEKAAGIPGGAVEGPYFSDSDRVAERIMAEIDRTRSTLDVAMYDLTEGEITAAIESAGRRGVQVRVVADQRQAQESHSEIGYLAGRGIEVRRSRGYRGGRSLMHNKFAVFDRQVVETGSFNWTTSAAQFNFENAIFLHDPKVASRYEKEFERIWEQAR